MPEFLAQVLAENLAKYPQGSQWGSFREKYRAMTEVVFPPLLAEVSSRVFIQPDFVQVKGTSQVLVNCKKSGDILPRWGGISQPEEQMEPISEFFRERQISRLKYVGSNEITKSTIEDSFKRFIHLLDKHLTGRPFLMGERPGASDFAVYGQLTCLALFDPTPQAIILAQCPRVYAWVEIVEELPGPDARD